MLYVHVANSLKLHALSHTDTPSEDFSIHSMKAIKLDLGLKVVYYIAIIQINESSYNKLIIIPYKILQPCKIKYYR